MSDNEEDLFADSDDTAELISSSKSTKPETTSKIKKLGNKRKRNSSAGSTKKKVPDADADDSDDDDKGLFDSDDEDAKKPAVEEQKPMSKRARMEALRKKKRGERGEEEPSPKAASKRKTKPGGEGGDSDSEDSYNSREYQLTEEDKNFIDTEGDDADAINELYSEQHFDDERGEAEEEPDKKKKKKGGGRGAGRRDEAMEDNGDLDNPIMAAVHKMKKKKRVAKKFSELEEEAKVVLDKMERAAEQDDQAIAERRPATKKLALLAEVVDLLTRREMTRVLLDLDLLAICRRWIQPLPNGKLGNVTIRQRLLESISTLGGENGITPNDLKRSEFGKVVMTLYMHKSETPGMKRQLKKLIEQWSRPIFQKSGNMRDLERVQGVRGEGGLSRIAKMNQQEQDRMMESSRPRDGQERDLQSMIKSGSAKGKGPGLNRVRVPFSKGFQYTVRPSAKVETTPEKRQSRSNDIRGSLAKRMVEKGRAVAKNQRSANISVEGRATK